MSSPAENDPKILTTESKNDSSTLEGSSPDTGSSRNEIFVEDGIQPQKKEKESGLRNLFHKFEDDGTLDLLRLVVPPPSLFKYWNSLIEDQIPEFNRIVANYNSLIQLETVPNSHVTLLRSRCFTLLEDLGRSTLNMDCVDLAQIAHEGSSKSSLRQVRKEMINICERLSVDLEALCKCLSDLGKDNSITVDTSEVKFSVIREFETSAGGHTNAVESSGVVPKGDAVAPNKRGLWDVGPRGPSHVGLYVSAPPIRKLNPIPDPLHTETDETRSYATAKDNPTSKTNLVSREDYAAAQNTLREGSQGLGTLNGNEDGTGTVNEVEDDDESYKLKRMKRFKGKRQPPTDWGSRVRSKIDSFKRHTAQGGCVTTLYEHPVNRDTMLSLLAKCELYLSLENPTPYQMKALSDLQQLRVNKTQMRLLYQSALVLDTLSTPSELLPELKSLQGLLKTFGMF